MAHRAPPVHVELAAVLVQPFSHQPQRSTGERTGDDGAVADRHLRRLAAIARVEVRRRVVAVVHLDHDPVELADPRHRVMVRSGADGVRAGYSEAPERPQDAASRSSTACGLPRSASRSRNGTASNSSGPRTPAPVQTPDAISSTAATAITAVCHTTAWQPSRAIVSALSHTW